MAELWKEVLGLERVGLGDNFFEVGGHSLLATQVITRVRETFEVEMPLRSLFENPTLSEFVSAVEETIVRSVEGLSDDEVWAML
jgi:acyl carrier protein